MLICSLEKFQQYRNRKIPDCNPDHFHGKNRICMENKKMKNLKTSCNLYLNSPLNEVHENAKILVLCPSAEIKKNFSHFLAISCLNLDMFLVVSHDSIRGCVRRSVGPSVRNLFFRRAETKTANALFRVYELVLLLSVS